jgi:hypothetical protein
VIEALGAGSAALEDALDEHFLLVDKPLSVHRFQSVVARFPKQAVDAPEGEDEARAERDSDASDDIDDDEE